MWGLRGHREPVRRPRSRQAASPRGGTSGDPLPRGWKPVLGEDRFSGPHVTRTPRDKHGRGGPAPGGVDMVTPELAWSGAAGPVWSARTGPPRVLARRPRQPSAPGRTRLARRTRYRPSELHLRARPEAGRPNTSAYGPSQPI